MNTPTATVPLIFTWSSWSNPAPGVWEAEAAHHTINHRPKFEARAYTCPEASGWAWTLYETETLDTTAQLVEIAGGRAVTLAEAQRKVEHAAQHGPVFSDAINPLSGINLSTVVHCTECGTGYEVDELEANGGRCFDPHGVPHCYSDTFDGCHADDLIAAAHAAVPNREATDE